MPRRPRECYPGAIYHLTTRRVEKRPIFLDDGDRIQFLALVAATTFRYRWRVHAYCQMTNHFHLVVDTPGANVSRAMQYLNSRYAEWFNKKYAREGHLVERRFRSRLLAVEEAAVAACRYVVLNPVRAGMCADPAAWPWSSHRATAGLAPVPAFLSLAFTVGHFGGDRAAYRAYVDEAIPALRAAA